MSSARKLEAIHPEPVAKRGTISGTFAKEGVEDDHAKLKYWLIGLETNDHRQMIDALVSLQSFLSRHFAREEAEDGLFDTGYRFEHVVAVLRSQHVTMLEMLSQAIVLARLPYDDGVRPSVLSITLQLRELLHHHEEMENDLLQRMLQVDIGDCD